MQAHKITVYVLDFEKYGIDDCQGIIQNKVNFVSFGDCATAEIGEWSDDHELNKFGAGFEKYFAKGVQDASE